MAETENSSPGLYDGQDLGCVPVNWLQAYSSESELSRQMGVTRATIHNWRSSGAPLIRVPVVLANWCIEHGGKYGAKIKHMRDDVRRILGLDNPLDLIASQSAGKARTRKRLKRQSEYDGFLPEPANYSEALQRERVIGESIENDKRRVQRDKARGQLIEIQEAANIMRSLKSMLMDQLQRCPAETTAPLADMGFDADQVTTIHAVVDQWAVAATESLLEAARSTETGAALVAQADAE